MSLSAAARNFISRLVRWASTTRGADDGGVLPSQQVGYLGKVGNALPWYPYGYHAVAPASELALMLCVQGMEEARVVTPGSPEKRPRPLAETEVALYHPPTGGKIHFRAQGDLLIQVGGHSILVARGGDITVTPAAGRKLLVVGDFEVTGAATFGTTVTSAGKDISDSHVHSGVTAGGSNTGPVV